MTGGASGRRIAMLAAIGLAMAAALVFGYAAGGSRPAAAQPAEKLSIALSTTPHAALLHLAAAKGYFAEEGLDVVITPVSHGKAALDLLALGKTDLAAAAEVPFVISVLKGEKFSIAASVVSVASEMAVVARRDRAIGTPRDLVGKKIGVTFGTSGDYFLWAFLIRNMLAPEAITLVDVPYGRMDQEIARGSIDAASTWEPMQSRARAALGENAVTFNESNAYTVTHVVVGRQEVMQARPKAMEKLVRALLKAERFARAEPQIAKDLIANRLKIDATTLRATWDELAFRIDLRQSHLITLEDEARWAMARGYAEKRPVPNFLPHLYLDALLAVRPERVTVVR